MVEHDMLQVDDCMVNGEAENKEGGFVFGEEKDVRQYFVLDIMSNAHGLFN